MASSSALINRSRGSAAGGAYGRSRTTSRSGGSGSVRLGSLDLTKQPLQLALEEAAAGHVVRVAASLAECAPC